MDPLIRIRGLYRYYGDFCAVDNLDLDLHAGEVLGFLGPNGAGKSTTMRIISGSLAPSRGEILLNGMDLLKAPMAAKRSLGYLPETPPLHRELTVDEYLGYAGRLRGISKKALPGALGRVKQRCGLEASGRRLIGNLSKGFQQRVGIAQALIHEPRVVVLDEPTSGLDPNQIQEIRELIRTLGIESGVILSTHILPEVQAVCDRVLILHQGRVAYEQPLAHNDEQNRLIIELANPPGLKALQSLLGVEEADSVGDGRFRLLLAEGSDSAAIAERAVCNGWQLRELTRAADDLEQTFVRITSKEDKR